jgi:hypothetical protein
MTQYLLELDWNDPVANRVRRLLDTLPAGVQQMTRQLPMSHERGFVLVDAEDRTDVEAFARAVTEAGAGITIVPGGTA